MIDVNIPANIPFFLNKKKNTFTQKLYSENEIKWIPHWNKTHLMKKKILILQQQQQQQHKWVLPPELLEEVKILVSFFF